MPTVTTFMNPPGEGSPATRETDVGVGFSKVIVPNFAVGFSEDYVHLAPDGAPSVGGFDNLGLNVKYQAWVNAPHEAIFAVGSDWDVGGTGSQKIGADSASTFTPTVYFGKGLGDLPDSLTYAKPLAVTGVVGEGRQPLREGASVLVDGEVVGELSSGNYSPVLGRGIGLGLLDQDLREGQRVSVSLRGREIAASVAALPFVRKAY